jgi:GntR family transcriptional regulator, transcriptional repressor for pyruvate dehydrogenase complex
LKKNSLLSAYAIFPQQLKHPRLHDEIVTNLQKQILTGVLAPGTRLPPERDLAESLGVNRATVREAQRRLEQLELLQIRHGDGVYVRDFLESTNVDLIKVMASMEGGNDMLSHLLESRRIVAPEMAFLAASRRSATDVEGIERILSDPGLSMMERDIKVHQAIARATGNLLFIILLNFFNQLFQDYIALYFDDDYHVERTRRFHHDIFDAIKNQEAGDARRIMLRGILHAEERIRKMLEGK